MRLFLISEMDPAAAELAARRNMGVEIIDFCCPENMENEDFIREKACALKGAAALSLHAPYYEIFPSAIDPMIRAVAVHRLKQALATCKKLGIRRMVAHSGFTPQIYYPEWFVPRSIEFWSEFARQLPDDFQLLIENVLDTQPEFLREICDAVDDPRVKICLDTGHANAYSDIPVTEWVKAFGHRIAHVHLHNNNGARDEHSPISCGSIHMPQLLGALDEYAPQASICIESLDAAACLRSLDKISYI